MRKRSILLTLYIIIAASLGQNRGFPVQAQFDNCIKPNHISQAEMDSAISDLYFYIRDTYIAEAGSTPGAYYVLSGMGTGGAAELITHSEAHGYGMLASVLMAGSGPLADSEAKQYYDGMYRFYDAHRSVQSEDLMSWQVLTDGAGGESFEHDYNATDGDMDIAYSLILAHYQWGSNGEINYLKEAKRMIEKGIKPFNINPETMRTQLGDWEWYYHQGSYEWYQDWSNGSGEWVQDTSRWIILDDYYWSTRPSDWMSGHMHAYAEHTNDPFWTEAADTIYSLTENFLANYSPTGLMVDFVDGVSGGPASEFYIGEFKETNQYFENACRTPWRFATDYAHYGSRTSYNAVNGMVEFIRNKTNEDPAKITWGYDITTGDELYPDTQSNRFSAPLVAGSIVDASHQQFLNDGWDYISTQRESYYSDYLTLLSMLLISGNWWPATDAFEEAVANGSIAAKSSAAFDGIEHSVANGQLSLNFALNSAAAEVQLFTMNGRKVASVFAESMGNGQFAAKIGIGSLGHGLYVVRVGNDAVQYTEKFMLK